VKMSLDECLAHIPNQLTPEMKEYVDKYVLKDARYIFTTREGKRQYGYCTYCKNTFETPGWRHGSVHACPSCGSEYVVKSAGMGRKRLVHEAYFTWFMKSAIDPNAIVAVGTCVRRDFSGDYRNVETHYMHANLSVFVFGKGVAQFGQYVYRSYTGGLGHWRGCGYQAERELVAHAYEGGISGKPRYRSRDNIAAAVAGTPFQYSTWERFEMYEVMGVLALYAYYPGIEYLVKAGFAHLVRHRLMGDYTFRTVKWRAKTITDALRLTKQDLREIREQGLEPDFAALRVLQVSRKNGSNLSVCEAVSIAASLYRHTINDFLKDAANRGGVRRLYNYLKKQYERNMGCGVNPGPYASVAAVYQIWKDYLKDCQKLQLDVTQDRIAFPRDLYQAHQHTISQIRYEADRALNEKIQERLAELKRLCFTYKGLLIRPAASSQEIVEEGRVLSHCVGRYAKDYAEGRTIILFIRRTSAPDKPFYTAELYKGQITQCYGYQNKSRSEEERAEVDAFMEAFKRARLSRRETQRQEVAS
jgi:predicted RNA-binding Zn-ribbon protein involved in translation (DUF1610 family)